MKGRLERLNTSPDRRAFLAAVVAKFHQILRMPLKRVTPSFTVEYRKAKRTDSGTAKSASRAAGPQDSDEISRSKPSLSNRQRKHRTLDFSGRILSSLVETTPRRQPPNAELGGGATGYATKWQ